MFLPDGCFAPDSHPRIGTRHLPYSVRRRVTRTLVCLTHNGVKVLFFSSPLCSIFSSLKVLNCVFLSLPSLQVHRPRALRGPRSAVVHQNLCQVQEKHRGASNWSVYQAARLDQRRSAELRMRASLLLMELKQLNLPLSIANYQNEVV